MNKKILNILFVFFLIIPCCWAKSDSATCSVFSGVWQADNVRIKAVKLPGGGTCSLEFNIAEDCSIKVRYLNDGGAFKGTGSINPLTEGSKITMSFNDSYNYIGTYDFNTALPTKLSIFVPKIFIKGNETKIVTFNKK